MELAPLQRALLGLIKGTYPLAEDTPPYLRTVAASDHLAMVRDVVHWWRAFQATRFCVLTSTLLRRQGQLDDAVSAFVRSHRVSPFIEEFGRAFLEAMTEHADGLVRSVAQFELALLKVKTGDREQHSIEWPRDPTEVLDALLNDVPLEPSTVAGSYRTVVTHRVPELFYVAQDRLPWRSRHGRGRGQPRT